MRPLTCRSVLLLSLFVPAAAFGDQPVADAGATAATRGQSAPRTHDDELLGRLEFDRELRQWHGNSRWTGTRIAVRVEGDDEELLADALATAHALWQAAGQWDARARRVAADQLIALYKDTWRDATDGPELDAAAFGERIVPQTVIAAPGGEFELWYGDDDLFGGHSIRVVGSLTDGPQAATIEG